MGPLKALNVNTWHYDDVIKWKHFSCYWPFVRGIHRSPMNSPHKGQWRGALMFSLICARLNGWANHRDGGDLRRHRFHYDITAMLRECVWYLVSIMKHDVSVWNIWFIFVISVIFRFFTLCCAHPRMCFQCILWELLMILIDPIQNNCGEEAWLKWHFYDWKKTSEFHMKYHWFLCTILSVIDKHRLK